MTNKTGKSETGRETIGTDKEPERRITSMIRCMMKMEMDISHAAGGEEADDGAGSEPEDVNTSTTANEKPPLPKMALMPNQPHYC